VNSLGCKTQEKFHVGCRHAGSIRTREGSDACHSTKGRTDHAFQHRGGIRGVCLFSLIGLALSIAILSHISSETVGMIFSSIE
jgi:hypothetical protein